MSSSMKDARWQRAIDAAAQEGLDFHALDYSTERVPRLEAAQAYLDLHPTEVEGLAKRFNSTEPDAAPWVEESQTAFAVRLARADGARAALLYAKVKVAPEDSSEALADAIDEYIADLERPKNSPSKFRKV